MKGILRFAVPALLTVSLAGCFNSSSDLPTPTPPPPPPPPPVVDATLRVVHASFDAPAVNISVNGDVVIENLAYGSSSVNFSLPPADYAVAVDAILPGEGNTVTVIDVPALALDEATNYKVFAVGLVADDTLAPLVVTSDVADLAAGNVRVQVVHAASAAPTVDVHVTAPDADLGAPLATLAFTEFTGALDVPAGEYRVRITLPGTDTVVFDSNTLELAGGMDLVVAAINSEYSGASPVSLIAVTPEGDVLPILDDGTTSSLRVVHNVSDAPAVDIVVNDNFAQPLVSALAFPDFTGYVTPAPGDYNVKVAVAGTETAVIDADVTLEDGKFYTVLAVGSLSDADDFAIEPLILVDNPRTVATEARVRLVHGSTLAGNVDIYVTADGDISEAMPAFSDVPYKAETGYVPLAAGEYFVTVTPTGTKTAAIETGALMLDANKIYTAIARDGAGLMGVGLTVMDGFVAGE
ncbi:hypothetical protein WG68_09710 [Arsukibacterium ikkense]|uniref:DUF4397 domain-containing protein n=1 Tax=Arsukibacterium ikkense TaxID=336831 RepID=A0A0M2V4T4_9GAMM|nr:DUF4397 domain-containing protein [Arsukibacterium ikkense]KKO45646.1 hypothetical protein WG68_09710 [Arsukibacterium ikkense]